MYDITSKEKAEQLLALSRLLDTVELLRSKCTWNKQQTMDSLRRLTIEEIFELSEAILSEDVVGIKEEIGDILLHIVSYMYIAAENNQFTLIECINALCDKIMARHPHVYQSDAVVLNSEEIKQNWQYRKLVEKSRDSILGGLPASLPSITKAMRIQDKVASAGFNWRNKEAVWEKVQEELQELAEEVNKSVNTNSRQARIEDEFGDVFFILIKYARFLQIDPEKALEGANDKFTKRFQKIEEQLKMNNKTLNQLSEKEIIAYWNQAKASLKDWDAN